MRKPTFELFAHYNQTMNQQIIEALENLSPDSINDNQNAFFGSILGTLNHLMVGDLIWLRRFSSIANFMVLDKLIKFPVPTNLNDTLFKNLSSYSSARTQLDAIIIAFIDEITEDQLAEIVTYQNTKGQNFQREFGFLLSHFFNHQTHHRGQISTLIFQKDIDIGVTDFLTVIPTH